MPSQREPTLEEGYLFNYLILPAKSTGLTSKEYEDQLKARGLDHTGERIQRARRLAEDKRNMDHWILVKARAWNDARRRP